MKKAVALIALISALALPLTGCGTDTSVSSTSGTSDGAVSTTSGSHQAADMSSSDDGVIVIKEKLFVAQTNEVYLNYEDYMGKTFSYEGIFLCPTYDGKTYYQVIRYGPGCCGYDQNAGFEVSWDGEYPEEDDWVKVVGTLDTYEEDGFEYLVLNLSSLEVLDERGAEYVS